MRNGGDEDKESTVARICAFHAKPGQHPEVAPTEFTLGGLDAAECVNEIPAGMRDASDRTRGSYTIDRKAF
jgi:hypothetical protein